MEMSSLVTRAAKVYFCVVLALWATACVPHATKPPPPPPKIVVEDVAATSELKERLRTERALTAALRAERDRYKHRLDDMAKQLADARAQVMRLLNQVEGLRELPPVPPVKP